MGNSNTNINVTIDEKGNEYVTLPDHEKQLLFTGEYCCDNMDKCYKNKFGKDNTMSPFWETIVPIKVYKKTVILDNNTPIPILTSLIIPPNVEVHGFPKDKIPDDQRDSIHYRKFRSEMAYVYSHKLLAIETKNRLAYDYLDDPFFWHQRICGRNITQSLATHGYNFKYTTGQKVMPANIFFSFAMWQLQFYPNTERICESGIHYFNHKTDAINYGI